jgi:integrase
MKTAKRAFGTVLERGSRPGYYVRFRWEGREYVRRAGPTKAGAERLLSRAHAKLAEGADVAKVLVDVFRDAGGPSLSLADAREEYLAYARAQKRASTVASDKPRLEVIAKEPWAKGPMHRIRSEDIARFLEELMTKGHKGKKCSGATAQRYLSVLSAMLKWAVQRGYIPTNPARGVRRPRSEHREREVFLTAEEAVAFVDAASDDFRPLVVFALGTGFRRGEVLGLEWRDVDLENGEVRVRAEISKSGRGRTVALPDDVRATLEAVRGSQGVRRLDREDRVFQLDGGRPWTVEAVRHHFAAAVKRAGAALAGKGEKLRFHDLRHSHASLAARAGVPIQTVSRLMGHSSLTVTMRYAHLFPDDGQNAAKLLGGLLGFGKGGSGGTKADNGRGVQEADAS